MDATTPHNTITVYGRTTEDVVRDILATLRGGDVATTEAALAALVTRFDRKAERRAAKAAA